VPTYRTQYNRLTVLCVYKLNGRAHSCANAQSRAYHASHRDEQKAYGAAYRTANRDRRNAYNAAYRAANPEQTKARFAAYRKTHPRFGIWTGIIKRTENPNHVYFKHYGGANPPVRVWDRWRLPKGVGFRTFVSDMGKKPTPQHSIGRFADLGNYEPGNVKWMSPSEQDKRSELSFGLTNQ
jgi:hypothetical protein